VPDDVRPSLLLRLVNPLARFIGTEMTRKLGPILRDTGLMIQEIEPVGMRGLLKIVLLSKPG
jgi:hypothetical protein